MVHFSLVVELRWTLQNVVFKQKCTNYIFFKIYKFLFGYNTVIEKALLHILVKFKTLLLIWTRQYRLHSKCTMQIKHIFVIWCCIRIEGKIFKQVKFLLTFPRQCFLFSCQLLQKCHCIMSFIASDKALFSHQKKSIFFLFLSVTLLIITLNICFCADIRKLFT